MLFLTAEAEAAVRGVTFFVALFFDAAVADVAPTVAAPDFETAADTVFAAATFFFAALSAPEV